MTLTIVIPCFNERENIIKILDKVDQAEVANKEIIVVDDMSTDGTREILEEKVKPRVSKIVYHEVNGGKGAALKTGFTHATGDILLFSDDDTYYCETFFQTIIESFKEYSHADIITFRGEDKDGNLLRTYSKVPYEYKKRPKKSYVCSWEIAYRKGSDIPQFDCRFGLGSDFLACGEEEVFIHQASQKGLTIYFIPKTVVITNDNTTGKQFFINPKVRYSKGAVLMLFYGYFPALLRIIKYAFIASKFNIGLSYSLFRDMYKGIQYIHKTNKIC